MLEFDPRAIGGALQASRGEVSLCDLRVVVAPTASNLLFYIHQIIQFLDHLLGNPHCFCLNIRLTIPDRLFPLPWIPLRLLSRGRRSETHGVLERIVGRVLIRGHVTEQKLLAFSDLSLVQGTFIPLADHGDILQLLDLRPHNINTGSILIAFPENSRLFSVQQLIIPLLKQFPIPFLELL